jgi:hypothetical protein
MCRAARHFGLVRGAVTTGCQEDGTSLVHRLFRPSEFGQHERFARACDFEIRTHGPGGIEGLQLRRHSVSTGQECFLERNCISDRAFESRRTGLPAVPVSVHVPIVESEEALAYELTAVGLVVGFLVSA